MEEKNVDIVCVCCAVEWVVLSVDGSEGCDAQTLRREIVESRRRSLLKSRQLYSTTGRGPTWFEAEQHSEDLGLVATPRRHP